MAPVEDSILGHKHLGVARAPGNSIKGGTGMEDAAGRGVPVPVVDVGGGCLAHVAIGDELQVRPALLDGPVEGQVIAGVELLAAVLPSMLCESDRLASSAHLLL